MDPFILRERFQGKKGSNFSSASLSGNILPGQGAEEAGAKMRAASGRMHQLAIKRQNTQNSLLAKQNTTKFALDAQQSIKDIEKQLKWNETTNSWGVMLGEDGEELSYYDAVEDALTTSREAQKTGTHIGLDNEYEKISSGLYQTLLLKAADRGLQLDADRQKKNYELTRDLATNLHGKTITDQIVGSGASGKNTDIPYYLQYNDGQIRGYIQDLREAKLDISAEALEELILDTRSGFTEALIDQFILQEDVYAVDELMKRGIEQSAAFEKGKTGGWEDSMQAGGSLFFLKPSKVDTIRTKIASLRGKIPPGTNAKVRNAMKNALSMTAAGRDASAHERVFSEQLEVSNMDKEYMHELYNQSAAASTDAYMLDQKLLTTPFTQHEDVIAEFENNHTTGVAADHALGLGGGLRTRSGVIQKQFKADPGQFSVVNDPVTRAAAIAWSNAKADYHKAKVRGETGNIDAVSELGERYAKATLDFQRNLAPGLHSPMIQTKKEITEKIIEFNREARNFNYNSGDEQKSKVQDYFEFFGKYGEHVYNELRDPKKYIEYSGDNLNSGIAVALIYNDTDKFNTIVGAVNEKNKLLDDTAMQWPKTFKSLIETELMNNESVQELMSAFGYLGYEDYSRNDFSVILNLYTLARAARADKKGTALLGEVRHLVNSTVHDLIESKFNTKAYENKAGGLFGFGSTTRYLSIPKEDNKGNPYDHEMTGRALETIKANPSLLGLEGEDISRFKSNGIFINNEDGSGFSVGFLMKVDRGGTKHWEIVKSDMGFKWKEFTAKTHSNIFGLIPSTTSEDIDRTIELLSEVDVHSAPVKKIIESTDLGTYERPDVVIPAIKTAMEEYTDSLVGPPDPDLTKKAVKELNRLSKIATKWLNSLGLGTAPTYKDTGAYKME